MTTEGTGMRMLPQDVLICVCQQLLDSEEHEPLAHQRSRMLLCHVSRAFNEAVRALPLTRYAFDSLRRIELFLGQDVSLARIERLHIELSEDETAELLLRQDGTEHGTKTALLHLLSRRAEHAHLTEISLKGFDGSLQNAFDVVFGKRAWPTVRKLVWRTDAPGIRIDDFVDSSLPRLQELDVGSEGSEVIRNAPGMQSLQRLRTFSDNVAPLLLPTEYRWPMRLCLETSGRIFVKLHIDTLCLDGSFVVASAIPYLQILSVGSIWMTIRKHQTLQERCEDGATMLSMLCPSQSLVIRGWQCRRGRQSKAVIDPQCVPDLLTSALASACPHLARQTELAFAVQGCSIGGCAGCLYMTEYVSFTTCALPCNSPPDAVQVTRASVKMLAEPVVAGIVPNEVPTSAAELVLAPPSASDTLFWTLKVSRASLICSIDSRSVDDECGSCKMDVRVASTDSTPLLSRVELHLEARLAVGDLKEQIWSLSGVPPARLKLIGLVKGKLPQDTELLDSLGLFEGKAITCLGTPEGQELQSIQGPGVVDDLDINYQTALLKNPALDGRNKRRVAEAAAKLTLNIMNEPRPNKRLLVLDLDYTILDCQGYSDETMHPLDMARPGLDAFLTAAYPHWDIVIWSQTSWKWLESKLVELNLVGHDHNRYHISFVLDRLPMFKVQSLREGQPYTHEVKALSIIWAKFPGLYSAKNSLDLGRNFVLNPGNGVKCRPFKDARHHRDDKELYYLRNYLDQMLHEPDLSKIDHSHWRRKPGVKEGPAK